MAQRKALVIVAGQVQQIQSTDVVDPVALGSGATGANFLRSDGTWATPAGGGGGATATTVEVNLGATPVWQGKFTITDAAISAASKVLCWQAPGPYTGKGTRADEAEMAPVSVITTEPASGSAAVKWQTPPMLTVGVLPDNNQRVITTAFQAFPQSHKMQRLGKVRGNFRFSYMVLA